MPDVRTNLYALITDCLGVDPEQVTDDARFIDLGADSLDTVELTMEVEEAFDVELDAEDALEAIAEGTPGKLLALVEGKLAEGRV